ncbi:MAG: hypothetical protein U0572_12640 [Phycisphaerales bacterium]
MVKSLAPDRLPRSIVGLKLLHVALWTWTLIIVCVPSVHANRPPVVPHALAWVPGVACPVAISAVVAALACLALARAPKLLVASIALIAVGAGLIVELGVRIELPAVAHDRAVFSVPRGVSALAGIACGTVLARQGLRSLLLPAGIDAPDVARLGRRAAIASFGSLVVGVALPFLSPLLSRLHTEFRLLCIAGIGAAAFAIPLALAAHALGRLLSAISKRNEVRWGACSTCGFYWPIAARCPHCQIDAGAGWQESAAVRAL